MAKLTATFELHDKISRKLRMIQGNAERLKRAANGPLIFEAEDRTETVGSACELFKSVRPPRIKRKRGVA